MTSINLRRGSFLAGIGLLTAVFTLGAFLVLVGDVAAHQPIGLQVSESDTPEPPCPYGHDDACEDALPPRASVNPFRSEDPHAHVHSLNAGADHYDHQQHLEEIATLNRQVLARLAVSGQSEADAESKAAGEPDGSGGGVSYAITSDITGLPWVRDGQNEAEKLTVAWLSELQEHNPSLVTALVRMPFLQDHTPGDLQAIQTLTLMSRGTSRIDPNPQYATALANHAAFADGGGVDNTEAKIIAVTSIPYLIEAIDTDGTDLVGRIADEGIVEEASVSGRYGNPLTFAIVRLGVSRQNSELMQSVTSATGHAETLMNQALPVDFVGSLVSSNTIPGAAAANNNIQLWFDGGFDREGTYSDRYRQRVAAHEIGHYWWTANNRHEAWISEGGAQYIGAYSVKTQFGDSSLYTNTWPCPYYRTIEHLRADNPQYGVSQGSLCNYALGDRLFVNLDRSMGHAAFTTGFRNLHQRLSTYEDDEIDQGLSLMRAFCSQCLTSSARLGEVGHTLARRYGEKILTDTDAATGTIAGLGSPSTVSLVDRYNDNRQYGVAQVSASSPDQRRWLRLYFSNAPNPPETVRVAVRRHHEDRYPYYYDWEEPTTVYRSESGPAAWFYVYLGRPPRWAIGHHWVYVYNESIQKVAEVEYQVTP